MADFSKLNLQAAFRFWINSEIHWADFFTGLGLNPDNHAIKAVGREWINELRELCRTTEAPPLEWIKTARVARKNQTQPGDIRIAPFERKLATSIPPVAMKECELIPYTDDDDLEPPLASANPEDSHLVLTQKLLAWRERQAIADWQLADRLRRYIKYVLQKAEAQLTKPSDDGEPAWHYSPSDIRHMAGAIMDLQKVQRMALGLSSENVGFPLRGIDNGGAQLPTVVVRLYDPEKDKPKDKAK
jgi:hypothetical protein